MALDGLTYPERLLWEACGRGDPVDLSEVGSDDAANVGGREQDRSIRAEVIRALLVGGGEPHAGQVSALRLVGAGVAGVLDLSHAEIRLPFSMVDCTFTDPPDLTWCRLRTAAFVGCRMSGFIARFAHVDGTLALRGCHIAGRTDFFGMRVVGQLDLQSARLSNPEGTALDGDGLSVESNLSCRQGFSAEGEVRLIGARIGASLEMDAANLRNPVGPALTADRLTVEGSVLCRDGFSAHGEIRLRSVRVMGDVDLSDAVLVNRGGIVLDAEHLVTEGGMLCNRLTTAGQINLFAAHVGGPLVFVGARLENPGGLVVNAEDGLSVGGSAIFNNMVAVGQILMLRASINGLLSFMGAQLTNPDATALTLDGLTVESGLHCGGGFHAVGRVRLTGARIGEWLNLSDARLDNPRGQALTCAGSKIRLLILHTREQITGELDLSHAQIERLNDDLNSWPDQVRLDGLTYKTLTTPGTAHERIAWLSKENSRTYLPQPYEELAGTYRRLGDDTAARTVLLVKHRRRRAGLRWHSKAWGYIQDVTVGYGFRPMRAAIWLFTLLSIGTLVYGFRPPPPTELGKGPDFNSLIYTLDVLLPIIDFGQQRAFNPGGIYQWLAYALITSGWILATTMAAGVTRTISRQ